MRRLLMILLLLGSLPAAFASDAVTGRVFKVLPLFLDLKGHDALSPSLYDRDAYQVYLHQHTNEVSAIRFDVLWKAPKTAGAKLDLFVELRGIGANGMPTQFTLGQTVTPGFHRRWTSMTLGGVDLKSFGQLVAWRATLWSGDQLIGEQTSFLW